MGGRGSTGIKSKGGAEKSVRQLTSLANAPTRNLLEGKTGTDKQRAYAEKLIQKTKEEIRYRNEQNRNLLHKALILSKQYQKSNKTKESELYSETEKAIINYKNNIYNRVTYLKKNIKKLKKIKTMKTYSEIIDTLK